MIMIIEKFIECISSKYFWTGLGFVWLIAGVIFSSMTDCLSGIGCALMAISAPK